MSAQRHGVRLHVIVHQVRRRTDVVKGLSELEAMPPPGFDVPPQEIVLDVVVGRGLVVVAENGQFQPLPRQGLPQASSRLTRRVLGEGSPGWRPPSRRSFA